MDTDELIKWGTEFFRLGYEACLRDIQKMGEATSPIRREAVLDLAMKLSNDNPSLNRTQTTIHKNFANEKDK